MDYYSSTISMNDSLLNDTTDDYWLRPNCGTRPLSMPRYIAVVFVGGSTSVVSTFFNCIAFSIIALRGSCCSRRALRVPMRTRRGRNRLDITAGASEQHQKLSGNSLASGEKVTATSSSSDWNRSVYLKLLIFSDVVVSALYIPLIVLGKLEVTGSHPWAVTVYWGLFLPFLVSAHVFKMLSTYLIVVMTFERLLIVLKWNAAIEWTRRRRPHTLVAVLLFVLVTKAPMIMELDIVEEAECTGLDTKRIHRTKLNLTPSYHTYYMFYFRNIVIMFLPFSLLACMNTLIVLHLKKQQRRAGLLRFINSEHKARVRSATLMLVMVVCTYLVFNLVNFIITVLEHVNIDLLLNAYLDVYIYASDMVPIFSVMACLLRFPVYVIFDAEVKREILKPFHALCRCICPLKHGVVVTTIIGASEQSFTENNNTLRPVPSASTIHNAFGRWNGSEFDRLAVLIAVNPEKCSSESDPERRKTAAL